MLDLLAPISEESACGVDIKYQPSYRKILELRKHIKEGKSNEYKELERLCLVTLTEESKELHILCILMETWIFLRGLDGAKEGISVVLEWAKKYWEDLYPKGDNHEVRSGVFMWMNTRLSDAVLHVKITEGKYGYTLANLIDARKFDEYVSRLGITKHSIMDQAKAEGKPLLEDIQKAINRTENDFYLRLVVLSQQCTELLKELETFLEDKIVEDPIFFSDLENSIGFIKTLSDSRLREEPVVEIEEDQPEELIFEASLTPFEKLLKSIEPSSFEELNQIIEKCISQIEQMNLSVPLAKLLKMALIWGNQDLLESFQILAKNDIDLNEILKITHLEMN